eukprot:TRINITY_DN70007_c0_g1_i1.p1 TRINITY_DN70007_c0_g1~~TRINITY_DN70007_c0_g1_i1.p1  ORF type:complete len:716 (+),score=223.14 TRINITY_DN70007_c0_g1_i1:77-2224(+)
MGARGAAQHPAGGGGGARRTLRVVVAVWVGGGCVALWAARGGGTVHEVETEAEGSTNAHAAGAAAGGCRGRRDRSACVAADCVWCCGESCWPELRSGRGVLCEAESARRGSAASLAFARRWDTAAEQHCGDEDSGGGSGGSAEGAEEAEGEHAGRAHLRGAAEPPQPTPAPTPPPTAAETRRRRTAAPRGAPPLVGGLPMEDPPSPPGTADVVGLIMQLRAALEPFQFGYGSQNRAEQSGCDKPWGEPKTNSYMAGCVDNCNARSALDAAQRDCDALTDCGGVVQLGAGHYELRQHGLHPSQSGEMTWVSPCRGSRTPATPEQVWETFHDTVDAALEDPTLRLGAKPPPVRSDGSILVSVASYRDPNCPQLVRSAFANAAHPEKVSLGIIQQNCNFGCRIGTGWAETRKVVAQPRPDVDCVFSFCQSPVGRPHCEAGRVRILRLEERESYGPFFARYLAVKQWRGEEVFVQVDAHSEFRQNWDDSIVQQLRRTPSYPASVISNYPPPHNQPFSNSVPAALCSVTFETVQDTEPQRWTVRLSTVGRQLSGDLQQPRHSSFIAAGFYAAHSSFMHKFDFDPFMPYLFMGEEICLTARFWTHGFDIYAPAVDIVRHEYIRKEAMKYWESVDLVFSRSNMHNDLVSIIIPRVQHVVGFPEASDPASIEPRSLLTKVEQFGVGKERSLKDFLSLVGLDLGKRTIRPAPWCTHGTEPHPVL